MIKMSNKQKFILTSMLAVLISFVTVNDFTASLLNPFSADDTVQIVLASGQKVNLESQIDNLLMGRKVDTAAKKMQAKLMLRNTETGVIELANFPPLERIKEKNTDLFNIPEEAVYEDKEHNLVWEKDATKSGLLTYQEAESYCQEFGEKAYAKPFHVPSPEELKTILRANLAGIDTNKFINLNDTYWTTHDFAYSFYYKDGTLVDKNKGLAYVRCVADL